MNVVIIAMNAIFGTLQKRLSSFFVSVTFNPAPALCMCEVSWAWHVHCAERSEDNTVQHLIRQDDARHERYLYVLYMNKKIGQEVTH